MCKNVICICLSDSYGGGEKVLGDNFNNWHEVGHNAIMITNNEKLLKTCCKYRGSIYFLHGMSQLYGSNSRSKRVLEIFWLNVKLIVLLIFIRCVFVNQSLILWANSHCSAYTFPVIFPFFRKKIVSIHIGRSSGKFKLLYLLFMLVGVRIIAVSDAVKETLINIGVPKKRIRVIHNGV